MPILPTYNHCCGCSACYAACPHNSITMCPDSEGFLYPDINSTTCTECKICEQVCPTLPYLDFAPYTLVRKRSTFPYNPKISCAQRINHTISNQAATKSFSLTKRERERERTEFRFCAQCFFFRCSCFGQYCLRHCHFKLHTPLLCNQSQRYEFAP